MDEDSAIEAQIDAAREERLLAEASSRDALERAADAVAERLGVQPELVHIDADHVCLTAAQVEELLK